MWASLLTEPLFCLPFTLGVYLGSSWIYRKTKIILFQPMLLTMAILIILLILTHTPYDSYAKASWLIDFLLGPSVVALGCLLYDQMEVLKGRLFSTLVSIFMGALVGIVTAAGIVLLLGGGKVLAASMGPKSVTTPIAISLSAKSGGIPALTAVVVVITGLFGGLVSPFLFKVLRIHNPIAKGLALGTSAHGMGTATAIQLGAVEGALAGMAIGIMGFFTAILMPLFSYITSLFS